MAQDIATKDAAAVIREEIRAGRHTTVTTGMARGYLQANLVILPADWADEFEDFCEANPKPCPLLARSSPGEPTFPSLGPEHSTFVRMCRAIASFGMAGKARRRPTSSSCGETISSLLRSVVLLFRGGAHRSRCADPAYRARKEGTCHLFDDNRDVPRGRFQGAHGRVYAQLHRTRSNSRYRDYV